MALLQGRDLHMSSCLSVRAYSLFSVLIQILCLPVAAFNLGDVF